MAQRGNRRKQDFRGFIFPEMNYLLVIKEGFYPSDHCNTKNERFALEIFRKASKALFGLAAIFAHIVPYALLFK